MCNPNSINDMSCLFVWLNEFIEANMFLSFALFIAIGGIRMIYILRRHIE
jgi:hypothetical protein